MLKFKNQDTYEARFRALQIVDERAAVKKVNGVLPDEAGAVILAPTDINAASTEDVTKINEALTLKADTATIQNYINEKVAALQSKSITDSGGHFTSDTVEGALQEIGAGLAGTYSKPSSGIPKADLAAAVQTSLGKADSALQTHQSLAALQTKSITDSGGHFTSDTVEGALQEIGAELAGINTLLGSGIQISFTINIPEESEVNTFSVVSGTTWKEWVGTGRPVSTISGLTLYCYSDDGMVFGDEAGVYALALDGTWVHGSDTIVSGAAYTIDHYGG